MQNDLEKIFQDLQSALPIHTFNTWIKPLKFKSFHENCLTIEVPNLFYKDKISKNYSSLIKEKIKSHHQSHDAKIAYVIQEQSQNLNADLIDEISRKKENAAKQRRIISNLNEKHTFSQFVVGHSNQFAHAASLAVSQNPGKTYNPLLIYGGVGLGKTHLLCAIGNAALQKKPNSKILYRTSEQFMNELINSIRYQKTGEFRNQFRYDCDLLLIDDVHFLSNKERTQEEFFHTFNTLHQANIQIVLTSDKAPHEIQDIDERLRSRFSSGLLCDITNPDVETRMAILQKKANQHNIILEQDVLENMAYMFKDNIRTLEGALIRLCAFAHVTNKPVDLALAKEVFSNFNCVQKTLNIQNIQQCVASHFVLDLKDMIGQKRNKELVFPRQLCMYLIRKHTHHSFFEIGKKFSNRDHSTVMHAFQKIKSDIKSQKYIEIIEKKLKSI